jgi:hypothetical protein
MLCGVCGAVGWGWATRRAKVQWLSTEASYNPWFRCFVELAGGFPKTIFLEKEESKWQRKRSVKIATATAHATLRHLLSLLWRCDTFPRRRCSVFPAVSAAAHIQPLVTALSFFHPLGCGAGLMPTCSTSLRCPRPPTLLLRQQHPRCATITTSIPHGLGRARGCIRPEGAARGRRARGRAQKPSVLARPPEGAPRIPGEPLLTT